MRLQDYIVSTINLLHSNKIITLFKQIRFESSYKFSKNFLITGTSLCRKHYLYTYVKQTKKLPKSTSPVQKKSINLFTSPGSRPRLSEIGIGMPFHRRRRREESFDKWRAAFESESLRRALSRVHVYTTKTLGNRMPLALATKIRQILLFRSLGLPALTSFTAPDSIFKCAHYRVSRCGGSPARKKSAFAIFASSGFSSGIAPEAG